MNREAARRRHLERQVIELGRERPRGVLAHRALEVWREDPEERDWWHGDRGVIVNGAALREREAYYDVVRIRAVPPEAAEEEPDPM